MVAACSSSTVHGWVQVSGSFSVISCRSTSGLTRVKRSTRVQVLAGAAEAGLRRVVERLDDQGVAFPAPPRVAVPLRDARVRTGVERNGADLVPHLLEDGHVVRRLQDLHVAVVAGAHVGRGEVQAAVAQGPVLGTVRRMVAQVGAARRRPLLRLRRHRRTPPVRRIDDERRAVVELPLHEPERVVVARDDVEILELGVAERLLDQPVAQQIAGLLGVPELGDACRQVGQLLVGQPRLVAELLGPLHRRRAVVGPDSLQIGLAVRRPRHRPVVLGGRGCGRQRKEREERHHDCDASTVHLPKTSCGESWNLSDYAAPCTRRDCRPGHHRPRRRFVQAGPETGRGPVSIFCTSRRPPGTNPRDQWSGHGSGASTSASSDIW